MNGLVISKAAHRCTVYGREAALTPLEFSILWYLCSMRGRVVASEELFSAVWGEKYWESNNTVMSHIARLREKLGGEITALSMGVPSAQRMLRDVLALGVDRAVLLTDRAFAGSDTLATATALSAAVRHLGGAGLILCGRMASDGDTAQVGPMLATMLELPCVTDVAAVEEITEHSARLLRLTDEGYQRVETSLPAVLTVVKEINVPRLPSIAGVLRGEQGEVRCLTAQELGVDTAQVGLKGSATKVTATSRPPVRGQCRRLTGTLEEMAQAVAQALRGKEADIHD